MNNNISLKYTAKKNFGIGEAFVSLVAALYRGAEYAAYVLGYLFCSAVNVFKSRGARLFVAVAKKYACVCAVTIGIFFFFGVIGGMESGTIAPVPGFIICCIMFAVGFAASNSRK